MTADALQLLPPRGLDQSILVGVLVGLIVLLILTEWFGWVFVGLVVPGYLASVFVITPAAGATVVLESILTFVIVRALSDGIARTDAWSPFFGRDRFFLIVLVSVIVRQASQLWLLEATLGRIDAALGVDIYAQQDFFSIGLVLVPLTANMFWKLSLRRGIVQIGVPVVLTYLVLRAVLLPETNLSFSLLELTYEDVALDFLGSAKAYVILLCGAYMAGRLNLAYGWDFNGILVPSLMALTWFSPLTTVVTLVEAVVLLGLTRLVLLLPGFRTANLEGPRKVTLVFVLGFFLKYAVAWYAAALHPAFDVAAMFGFGYVLTSLLAVKMLNLRAVGRVVLPTALVSLGAFIIGSAVGFVLDVIAPGDTRPAAPPGDTVATTRLADDPLGLGMLARARARPDFPPDLRGGLSGTVLSKYARLWRDIDRWLARGDDRPPGDLEARAQALGLRLHRLPGDDRPTFALLEAEERLHYQRGLDTALLRPGAGGPIIEVPRPRTEAPTAEAAAVLCERLSCRAVLWAGADSADGGVTVGDALAHPRATMHVAHLRLRSAPVLVLRSDRQMAAGAAVLHLQHTLAREIDLRALWPEPLDIDWAPPPGGTLQWHAAPRVAVLRAHPHALRRVFATGAAAVTDIADLSLADRAAYLADGASALRPASETELRAFEQLIDQFLAPAGDGPDPTGLLSRTAAVLGYRVTNLADGAGPGVGCRILEPADPSAPSWGVVARRRSGGDDLAVEVPRPRAEPGTYELGVGLWRTLEARFAYIAPSAGPGDDPTAVGAVATPLQAFHRSAHRALLQGAGLILQARGFGAWRPIDVDVVVGLGAPVFDAGSLPPAVRDVLAVPSPVARVARGYRAADASQALYPLVAQGTPQLAHSRAIGGTTTAILWFSSRVRDRSRARAGAAAARAAARVGLPRDATDPVELLVEPALAPPASMTVPPQLQALIDLATTYADTRDVRALARLRQRADGEGAVVRAGDSRLTGGGFLFLARGGVRAVVPLGGEAPCAPRAAGTADTARLLAQDLLAGCRALVVVGAEAAP